MLLRFRPPWETGEPAAEHAMLELWQLALHDLRHASVQMRCDCERLESGLAKGSKDRRALRDLRLSADALARDIGLLMTASGYPGMGGSSLGEFLLEVRARGWPHLVLQPGQRLIAAFERQVPYLRLLVVAVRAHLLAEIHSGWIGVSAKRSRESMEVAFDARIQSRGGLHPQCRGARWCLPDWARRDGRALIDALANACQGKATVDLRRGRVVVRFPDVASRGPDAHATKTLYQNLVEA